MPLLPAFTPPQTLPTSREPLRAKVKDLKPKDLKDERGTRGKKDLKDAERAKKFFFRVFRALCLFPRVLRYFFFLFFFYVPCDFCQRRPVGVGSWHSRHNGVAVVFHCEEVRPWICCLSGFAASSNPQHFEQLETLGYAVSSEGQLPTPTGRRGSEPTAKSHPNLCRFDTG
jgi:hypothetical protein